MKTKYITIEICDNRAIVKYKNHVIDEYLNLNKLAYNGLVITEYPESVIRWILKSDIIRTPSLYECD